MMNKEIKYSIKKMFGSYSIVIEEKQTAQVLYDINDNIINIIKQLEREKQELKELVAIETQKSVKRAKQRDLYKSVIDEVREFTEENMKCTRDLEYSQGYYIVDADKVLEILDKAKIKEDRLGGDVGGNK